MGVAAAVGRTGHRRLPAVRLDAGGRRPAATGSDAAQPNAGSASSADRNGNLWAWWAPRIDRRARRRGHRQPPGLGAGRRRLRRPARRGVRVRRGRPAARARAASRPGRSRWPRSARRRAPGSAWPASGRRLLAGAIDAGRRPAALPDADGVTLAEAMTGAGQDPAASARTPTCSAGIGAFVELHVEQGRALADLGAPVGVAERSGRTAGGGSTSPAQANHAGTTRLGRPPRPDAAVRRHGARRAQAAAARHGALATVGKVAVEPGAANAIRSAVARLAGRPGRRTRTTLTRSSPAITARRRRAAPATASAVDCAASRSRPSVEFDDALRDRPSPRWPAGSARPVLPTGAGHDAGCWPRRCRPRCCSCATRPGSRTRRPSTPSRGGLPGRGRRALADVLEDWPAVTPVTAQLDRLAAPSYAWLPSGAVRGRTC